MREQCGPLEMWGGIEATVNRVGDAYFDQMARNGHLSRGDDLERIAELGIRTLRYPVLWEHAWPDESSPPDWTWTDERLGHLRALGIRPIAGLTHHGSGPRHTSLVDAAFATKLARYARAVAERYPHVTHFTPVNEPLTTARFSGLYGHWYPHARDPRTFARALVNQCRGIALSMDAIREVTPGARLVQTEDLGRVYSTPQLAKIAEHQNQRRWLSFDLLCGRLRPEHPLWAQMQRWGIGVDELEWFVTHPCPPDVVGINHYLTSDRFLDQNLAPYPESRAGSIDGQRHADVEAVRARLDVPVGACSALLETWERYHLPLAVTEAHLGGTREEQIRWLHEIWVGASRLRRAGADVRAVTAWSIFGAFDWNVLVTRENGFYEPGAFDVRAPSPRRTALGRLVCALATTGRPGDEPLLEQPGWWRRSDRLFHEPARGRSFEHASSLPISDMRDRSTRPLLVLGPTGTLGRALVRLCDARGVPHHLLGRRELDFRGPFSIDAMLLETNAWAVINAAGFVDVDRAEAEPEVSAQVNSLSPGLLAEACARHDVPLVTFSSDLVFDGRGRRTPYTESDAVGPLSAYGRSKAEMEQRVLAALPTALVIRTSSFFGPWDDANFVTRAVADLTIGRTVRAARDQIVSPTYVPDLVHAALDLLIDGERGIWHLANRGAISWSDLARLAAEMGHLPVERVVACPSRELGLRAPRPRYSALGSERGWLLPSLEDGLERYFADRAQERPLRRAA
jgi:dTDP-4-dehydrorhamnose reductase